MPDFGGVFIRNCNKSQGFNQKKGLGNGHLTGGMFGPNYLNLSSLGQLGEKLDEIWTCYLSGHKGIMSKWTADFGLCWEACEDLPTEIP